MATVACKCGEKFHPSPEHFGKEVRCRRCGRMVKLIPDPSFDQPPKAKSGAFTQSFTSNAPPLPTYSYTPPTPQPPPRDPNAPPRGLHPEIRKILIYTGVVLMLVAAALIASVFKNSSRPPSEAPAGESQ